MRFYMQRIVSVISLICIAVVAQNCSGVGDSIVSIDSSRELDETPTLSPIDDLDEYSYDGENILFENRAISGFSPEGLVSLGGYYIKNSTQVAFEGNIINPADAESFRFLGDHYSKDDNRVYFKGVVIRAASTASFEVLNYGYARDSNGVYFNGSFLDELDVQNSVFNGIYALDDNHIFMGESLLLDISEELPSRSLKAELIVESDISVQVDTHYIVGDSVFEKNNDTLDYTLETVDLKFVKLKRISKETGELSSSGVHYVEPGSKATRYTDFEEDSFVKVASFENIFMDSLGYAFERVRLDNLDIQSLEFLDDANYFKDNQNVWYRGNLISERSADFKRLGTSKYYVDTEFLFYEGERIQESFLSDKINGIQVFNESFLKISDQYYIKRGSENILNNTGADLDTWTMVDDVYSKDKDNVYARNFLNLRIVTSDISAFEALSFVYSKDSSKVYYQGFEIEGLSADSFSLINPKKSYWLSGNRIGYGQELLEPIMLEDGIIRLDTSGRGGSYLVHQGGVYFGNSRIDTNRPEEFRLLGKWYSTDGIDLFYRDMRIDQYDPSFNASGDEVSSDLYIYDREELIPR